ncbi:uncharacterized protein DS421_1g28430 [Arachis hypogaea]|nr:uncharacterized protein DS421_1g28430 [Arachis hypogaea]
MVVVIEQRDTLDRNANPFNTAAFDGFETASDTDLGSDAEGEHGRASCCQERSTAAEVATPACGAGAWSMEHGVLRVMISPSMRN